MEPRATIDILHPKTGEVIIKKGKKFTKPAIQKMNESNIKDLPVTLEEVIGKVSLENVADPKTGEVLVGTNEALSESKISDLINAGSKNH